MANDPPIYVDLSQAVPMQADLPSPPVGSVRSNRSRQSVPLSEHQEVHRELQRLRRDAEANVHARALERQSAEREKEVARASAFREGEQQGLGRRGNLTSHTSRGSRPTGARSPSPVTTATSTAAAALSTIISTFISPAVETATRAPTQFELGKPERRWFCVGFTASSLGW